MPKPLKFLSAIALLTTTLFSFTAVFDNVVDRLGIKGPLEFNKTKFNLAWSDKPNDIYYIQEYLPEGEKLETFNQMLTVHLFIANISVNDAVLQKEKELIQRRKTDEVCNYQVTESPDGKEFIIDCILSESKGGELATVEFIIYRYKQIDLANNKNGIMIYAYSKRSYGDNITAFLSGLGNERTERLNEMISIEIPAMTGKF